MQQMLTTQDPEIAAAIASDVKRQTDEINLIASENYASAAVLEATGSVLTNKYAEGYPGRRYYAGCENADAVETLAIDRVKDLFGVDAANVQPTAVHRPTWPPTSQPSPTETGSWACNSTRAGT